MYSTNLVKVLNDKINSATNAEEVHYLSEAIRKLNIGVVKTVATYADMTSLFGKHGDVVFVESEEALYFSVYGATWIKIFYAGSIVASAWGANASGQIGDNTSVSKSSPVSVVGGFTDWIQVNTSGNSSFGVRSNGTAWAWGNNNFGRLGDNTTVGKISPVSVIGGFTDWIQLYARNHSLGLRANGTVWTWGYNTVGQLGNGTTTSSTSPVSIIGGFVDWIQVSAGGNHCVGIRSNRTAWAWGWNTSGQLGDNTVVNKSSPVSVVGGFADWIQLSAGTDHTLGLRSNGTAWAWGYNSVQGKLGNNSTIGTNPSPVSVVGGFTDWVQLSAGGNHSLGLRANGTAWSWGNNTNGRLGDNSASTTSSPVSVIGGFTDWIQLSAGGQHSVGLRANGTAWAWGSNTNGQLGDNTTGAKSSPVSVAGGFTSWFQLSSNGNNSIGLRTL